MTLPLVESFDTTLSPVVMAGRLQDGGTLVFLDTQRTSDGRDPISIIGRHPWKTLSCTEGACAVDNQPCDGDVWNMLRSVQRESQDTGGNLTGLPGPHHLFGYLSYDLALPALHVPVPPAREGDSDLPASLFFLFDELVVRNHRTRQTWLVAGGRLRPAKASVDALRGLLQPPMDTAETPPDAKTLLSDMSGGPTLLTSNFTQASYQRKIEEIHEYIGAGDTYIVNLSRQLRADTSRSSWDTYLRLRAFSPVPFGAYLTVSDPSVEAKDFSILSASMESFLRIRNGQVETRPIKGTRPRGTTPEEDEKNRSELLSSKKDKAELLMIVDLERNDLSRVCTPESVEVRDLYRLEAYASVFHLDAVVQGTLSPGKDAVDALEAMFPGGSITGAPKVRSMEIISEMENTRRGVYTGCLGWIGPDQSADFNILIRTLVRQNGQVWYATGGGITWDSDPEAEYRETQDKAAFLERVV